MRGMALAGAGVVAVLTGRRTEPLEETAGLIRQKAGKAEVEAADMTDAKAAQAIADRIKAKRGRLDILVNNAGVNILERHWDDLNLERANAEGKVLVASQGGKSVPANALITPDGKQSGDPAVLYGPLLGNEGRDPRKGHGAIRAFGEHKGSGLAFLCEILAGALTGGGTAGPTPRERVTNGMLAIYMAPQFFHSDDSFAREAREYIEFYKSARPAEARGEVLVPGEPESRSRAQRLAEGVPLTANTWSAIGQTALAVGLTAERVARAADS